MIAYTYFGGQDLYHGVPDLQDAKVVEVRCEQDSEYYNTHLVFELKNGSHTTITIKQERH